MIKIGQIYRQNCHNTDRVHKVEMTLNRSNIQTKLSQHWQGSQGRNDIK